MALVVFGKVVNVIEARDKQNQLQRTIQILGNGGHRMSLIDVKDKAQTPLAVHEGQEVALTVSTNVFEGRLFYATTGFWRGAGALPVAPAEKQAGGGKL